MNHQFSQSRRIFVIIGFQVFVFFVLMGRLFFLQIIQGRKYRKMALKNGYNYDVLIPIRGLIVERKGRYLTDNIKKYELVVILRFVHDLPELIANIKKYVQLTQAEENNLKNLSSKTKYFPVTIKENLTWNEVSVISYNQFNLPGCQIRTYKKRYYPYHSQFVNIVGYMGYPSAVQKKNNTLLSQPEVMIGQTNLERSQNNKLTGTAGLRQNEVNAKGAYIQTINQIESVNGKNIYISILLELQNKISLLLSKYRAASSVVLNIHTGEVLAMVSNPSIDPNIMVDGVSIKQWNAWKHAKVKAFINRAVGGRYAPGSTFKIVSALALQKGGVRPEETVHCPGYYDLGNRRFYCWKRSGHGVVNLHKSIVQSCDVYYYIMSQRIGVNAIAAMANTMGYNHAYDIGLDGVISGIVPNTQWKERHYGEPWRTGETLNVAIGQGYLVGTPLQIALVTARLISRKQIVPFLYTDDPTGFQELNIFAPDLPVNPVYIQRVINGMIGVVNTSHGTAYHSRTQGWKMGGKTGTSQVKGRTGDEREAFEDDVPWNSRVHSVFTAFTPLKNTKYSVCTLVEHGGSGAGHAAHLTHTIVNLLREYTEMKLL